MKIYLVYRVEVENDEAICCFTKKEEAEKFIQEIRNGKRLFLVDDDNVDDYVLLPNGKKYEACWFTRDNSFSIKELYLI